ncbi:hypothetical protein TNCV_3876011 [Trichonephila clavipes]|uniref:Uncharacterized protein n=1 Tax=Trichonephila clavipes TaxID=2585209 RepID=A0A8X6SWF0_TRICX|nr:hypothetical protein TNCV_3876011 [Trichonephila clavipes]
MSKERNVSTFLQISKDKQQIERSSIHVPGKAGSRILLPISFSHKIKVVSRKKTLRLQETLDLLQNLPSKRSDALTDNSSSEEVPSNCLMELLQDS